MSTEYVQLLDFDTQKGKTEISKASLYNIHQIQLSNDQTNEPQIHQLVKILGGIDDILSHYLSPENNINLSQMQINQINQIISNPSNKSAEIGCGNNVILEFQSTNTFLHKLFNVQLATKIINYISNKFLVAVMSIISIILFVSIPFVENWNLWNTFHTIGSIWALILLLWLTPGLLSINIAALKLSMKQFIFWFKIGAATQYTAASIALYQINWGRLYGDLWLFILIVAYCAMDGFYLKRRSKVIWSLIFALVWSIYTIHEILRRTSHPVFIQVTNDWSISMELVREDAMKVLSIFMWKQAAFLILKPNKCVNIQLSPYLKWMR